MPVPPDKMSLSGVRSTHMQHVYDFYKPDMSSEYPVVDGKLSVQCYLSALDTCYGLYKKKAAAKGVPDVNLAAFDAVLFHSPYCKLVQKSQTSAERLSRLIAGKLNVARAGKIQGN